MYNKFFGFKEKPFKLVPNPDFLFLSKSHEEALAHLIYATSQGDGFVEITGEVGTGKTTLCRVFLDKLDKNTESAFIFNPKLDSVQLLKAINTELGLPSTADNTRDLINELNRFLVEKTTQGKRVIVLIDEAQNLPPETLEQIRMLSNFETTRNKLLQIILVGQPELGDMLDSYELRQLAQRITLSCHLLPLTYQETREYIQHRINIASSKPSNIFSAMALRAIYRYSAGIPRLINIACDRGLLTAFGLGRNRVSGSMIKTAVRELASRGNAIRPFPWIRTLIALAIIFAVLMLGVILIVGPINFDIRLHTSGNTVPDNSAVAVPEQVAKGPTVYKVPEPMPTTVSHERMTDPPLVQTTSQAIPADRLQRLLSTMDPIRSRLDALKNVLSLWETEFQMESHLTAIADDLAFFRAAAGLNELQVFPIGYDFRMIENLNLPVIIAFHVPDRGLPAYMALTQIITGTASETYIVLVDPQGERIQLPTDQLLPHLTGAAYILWKNFLAYDGVIPSTAPKSSVLTLKMILRDLGFEQIEIDTAYDQKTQWVVETLQAKHGLRVDGRVGPLTKIVLYNESKALEIPHLKRIAGDPAAPKSG